MVRTGGEGLRADWRRPDLAGRPLRREMIVTSVLDADPQYLVTLPTHSWWPLVLALGLGVAMTGALVDAVPLGLLGVVGMAVAVLGWLWSREDEMHS